MLGEDEKLFQEKNCEINMIADKDHQGLTLTLTLTLYSSSTSCVEYQAGGGKGLVDIVNQLTLERCHSF